MIDFQTIRAVEIEKVHLTYVYDHLKKCGSHGFEGVVLWAGTINNQIFTVTDTIIPVQKSFSLEEGLLYRVEEEELHRINVWLYKNKRQLMIQIHSHPTEAYHSETDNRYPIVAQHGGISIVVPNFGFDPFSLESWAAYQLSSSALWEELSLTQKKSLFYIIE